MQEKNQILNELLTKEKSSKKNESINFKTCAETTRQTNVKPKEKKVPKLIVKKTNNNDNTIPTKKVIAKINDTIVINCMNVDSVEKIKNSLDTELNQNFKVKKNK